VVDTLRTFGTLSRTDLANRLGYSRALMTGIVKDLLDAAILVEGKDAKSTGGRRARMLNFNPEFGYVLGVDLGATSVDMALADFREQRLARFQESLDVRLGPEAILNRILSIAQDTLDQHGIPTSKLLSIGIGVPGPVDFANGVLIVPPIMPGWERYPIRQKIREHFPATTVVVDNDVNVMAMGELRTGAGRAAENFIFVKIGTGIGAGIVVHRQVYRGSDGCAGDIGHIQADRDGPVCHCGNVGCIEVMASGAAMARKAQAAAIAYESPALRRYLDTGVEYLTAEHVGAAAHEGDPVALEIIQTSGTLIGEVLAGIVNFFNPSLILIGGGVTKIGTQFLAAIRRGVLSRSLPLSTQHLRIDYSSLGDDAGTTGAIALAAEHIFIAKP
jgi:glucokinase-like ROK family protein